MHSREASRTLKDLKELLGKQKKIQDVNQYLIMEEVNLNLKNFSVRILLLLDC